MVSEPPIPTATNIDPFQATPYPVVRTVVNVPVQLIPSGDIAIESIGPFPTPTHVDPFHARPYAVVMVPTIRYEGSQIIPSIEYANVLVLSPATVQ
jgi:hypothetical protein